MKKLFKPASLLLYFLTAILSFILGLLIAKWVGAGKNQMLAGGAIVLFYGLVSSGIAVLLAVLLAYSVPHRTVVRINQIAGLIVALLVGWGFYTWMTREPAPEPSREYPTKPTAPANDAMTLAVASFPEAAHAKPQASDPKIGIGMYRPEFGTNKTHYFYGGMPSNGAYLHEVPIDSLVFSATTAGEPVAGYGPPWLYPQHLKLDYGIIFFKAIGVSRNAIKVEVNRETGQLAFMDSQEGEFLSWTEFLLTVHSVELPEWGSGTIRSRPMEAADEVRADYAFMQPILIEADWMQVRLVNEDYHETGQGWIRWRDGERLLIAYSLLS